jgi:hypothetical protein
VAFCSEFPNDNPALHRGALWVGSAVGGGAWCEAPEEEVVEAKVESLVTAVSELASELAEVADEPPTDPGPPILEADDPDDDIEIVEDLAFDELVDEAPAAPAPAESSVFPVADDPFVTLATVLEGVAQDAGAGVNAITSLRVVLGRERVGADTPDAMLVLREQAAAWQAILRNESEDFSGCGVSSLDEWSAIVVATAMGEMHRADGLRRELRRRGVAAFGLVEAA